MLRKRAKATFLIAGIALSLMFGSVQQTQAAYYNNYYSWYTYYLNLYRSTGNTGYLYGLAYPAYYYYLGGLYGDYTGVNYDRWGSKSMVYVNFTYAGYYYNYYDYDGDFYYRNY